MNVWKYEEIKSLEHGLVVKDILPWVMSAKQGLTSKPWGVCMAPSAYIEDEMECHTRYGPDSKKKGEPHLVDVRTIQVIGGTLT